MTALEHLQRLKFQVEHNGKASTHEQVNIWLLLFFLNELHKTVRVSSIDKAGKKYNL